VSPAAKTVLRRSRVSAKSSSTVPDSRFPTPDSLRARKAGAADAPAIHRLVAHYAAQGLLLPRSEEEIREHVHRFFVLVEAGRVIGCVALESYGADLAEIRSLAVDPEIRGRGLGGRLVQFALAQARRRGIARVFAVTHAPEFFCRQGFARSKRQALPEKIARDCCACPKARCCELVAVIADAAVRRAPLEANAGVSPDVRLESLIPGT
jgi:amino-acid N-acetyltransferase